jgi:hypothetical protein
LTNKFIIKKQLDKELIFNFRKDFSFLIQGKNKNKIHPNSQATTNDEYHLNKTTDYINDEIL